VVLLIKIPAGKAEFDAQLVIDAPELEPDKLIVGVNVPEVFPTVSVTELTE